jgi:hypothetical protein
MAQVGFDWCPCGHGRQGSWSWHRIYEEDTTLHHGWCDPTNDVHFCSMMTGPCFLSFCPLCILPSDSTRLLTLLHSTTICRLSAEQLLTSRIRINRTYNNCMVMVLVMCVSLQSSMGPCHPLIYARPLVIIPMDGRIDISSNEWTWDNRRKSDNDGALDIIHWKTVNVAVYISYMRQPLLET